MEEWKDIKNFEGLYRVSNTGKVFSVKSNKILKTTLDKYGYKRVTLYNGKRYYKTIHRLVAQAYLKPKKGCNVVNHLDSDKLNNNVDNLEWTTVSGNTKHCFENNKDFRKQVMNNALKGANKMKKPVVIRGVHFESQTEASKYFGVTIKTIYNWLHYQGGEANAHYKY